MNYKTLLTRVVLATASEQEYALLQAFLESDDEAAEMLCQYDIPAITSMICKSDVLSAKAYASKYANLMPLYRGMNIAQYIDTVFLYNIDALAPLLDLFSLKQICDTYELRAEFVSELGVQKQQLEDRIKQRAEDRQKAKDEGKELSKKAAKKMEENNAEDKKRIEKLKARVALLSASWGNSLRIREHLQGIITAFADTQSKKLEVVLGDATLEQHFSEALQSTSKPSEDSSELVERIRSLEADLHDLRALISSQQKIISNLQADKRDADLRIEQYESEIEKLHTECAKLKANCDAYNSILLGLSGQIVDAIYAPICELERIVFEIEDSSQSPRDIANWLKEPINELRDNFEKIELNPSGFDSLVRSYSISIASIDDLGSWECRVPAAYDDEMHTCKVEPTEFVYLRNRGFLYKNNLGQVKIKKADVIPCITPTSECIEQESVEEGNAE